MLLSVVLTLAAGLSFAQLGDANGGPMALAADGAGEAGGTHTIGSGIEGEVVLGPIRSREQPGVPNERPYQATITILDRRGQVVGTVASDARGNFRVELPPGTYRLRPESPGTYPRAPEQTVIVRLRQFSPVRIPYDSGIR